MNQFDALRSQENEDNVQCEFCGNILDACMCVCPYCGRGDKCECCVQDPMTGG